MSLGKTTFQLTTSVGKCLHTYDLKKGLSLVFLSQPLTPYDISATCAWQDKILAGWSNIDDGREAGIWVFQRGKKIDELEGLPNARGQLEQVTVFGQWIVGCYLDCLEVWKSTTYEHHTTIIPTSSADFSTDLLSGKICGVPTLLNKIFAGRKDGAVDIWNVGTGKMVYTLGPLSLDSGAVTALEPSPALNILAIGREDGSISLHDVVTDQLLMKLRNQAAYDNVPISIAFRTDGLGAGRDSGEEGIIAAAARGSDDVTFWDMQAGGRVTAVLHGAHSKKSANSTSERGGVNHVEFLPGQNVMISSGSDNALRSWIFDTNLVSPTPRLLHQRAGHGAPITKLSFVPSSSDNSETQGKWLMSAGRDQALWAWSLRRDGQSSELSQGKIQKKANKLNLFVKDSSLDTSDRIEDLKAPDITTIACSLNRDAGMGTTSSSGEIWTNTSSRKPTKDGAESNSTSWESVVTGHRGDKYARTWYWGRKRAGRWALETGDGTEVTAVAITICGTFALVGSAGGSVVMYNLQSGLQRQRFPSPLTPAQARRLKVDQISAMKRSHGNDHHTFMAGPGQGKHNNGVSGIAVDSLNRNVITCGLDGKIKFWDFLTGCLIDEINWFPMTVITSCSYYRKSDLFALSCDDPSIRVVDIQSKRTVRELWGCLGQINDFCFSSDGRWIIAASMDSVVRVWDLPTGHLIHAIRLDTPCTALAFSDTGEFLATAHADSVGIHLWNNRALFTHVPTRRIRDNDILTTKTPMTSGETGQGLIDAAFDGQDEEVQKNDSTHIAKSEEIDTLDESMQNLSLVPRSRWLTLLHLDTIKRRNKPIEPPKAPEKAPFFLPSLDGDTLKSSAVTPNNRSKADESNHAERSRILKMDKEFLNRPFTKFLLQAASTGDFEPFISHLSELPPSAADVEIRSLNSTELLPFVHALAFGLRQRRDYELMQVWMSVFLNIHGEMLNGEGDFEDVLGGLQEWRDEQIKEAKRLGDLVGFCGGVIGFLRSVR